MRLFWLRHPADIATIFTLSTGMQFCYQAFNNIYIEAERHHHRLPISGRWHRSHDRRAAAPPLQLAISMMPRIANAVQATASHYTRRYMFTAAHRRRALLLSFAYFITVESAISTPH